MKRNRKSLLLPLFASFFALLFALTAGCTREKYISLDEGVRREYRIAVVLPYSRGMENHWHRSIDWALENLRTPLRVRQGIRIEAEWYDEETSDVKKLFTDLAAREDIQAIIGPLYSAHADTAAQCCSATGKPLLPALASSELLMRAYAGKGFLWCLTENDISQCEILLTLALQKGARSVSLLTPEGPYGQTFVDWFAFQAKELQLDVHSLEIYTEANLEEKMKAQSAEDTDCLLCVSSGFAATATMNRVRRSRAGERPQLLFADMAFQTEPDETYEGMEGVVQIQDPQSGFHIAYEARYGQPAGYGSAHFYDAALLTGLAILEADRTGDPDINAAMRRVVDGDGEDINDCTDGSVARLTEEILAGARPHVCGASGKLRFDPSLYTNVLHSAYCHWQVYEGKHLVLEYTASDDSNRTGSSVVNWNWRVTRLQDFSRTATFSYPEKTGLYALIIAPSAGWENYRHQADAYAFYQLLKQNGLPDDRILLVAEDDLAWHTSNLYPGSVYIAPGGDDVRQGVKIDYRASQTDLSALAEVLKGSNAPLARPDTTDNLLVYWAGHGDQKGLKWLDETIPAPRVADFFSRLAAGKGFRKTLFILEACYAGQVGKACEGIPRLLCLTAAGENETSRGNRYSAALHAWLSNSFSDAVLEAFAGRPDDTLYELYNYCYSHTLASHVSVYNAASFDNLYTTGFREFIYP